MNRPIDPHPHDRISFRFPTVPPGSGETAQQRAERRQRLMVLGSLASGLAHEIKNPLSTMKLNLQLLQTDWKDADSDKEKRTARKLGVLMDEVRRLEKILEEFLAFARGNELDMQLADIGQLVKEVADFVEPELTAAQPRITLWSSARAGELPRIAVDTDKLRQALLNLIINARQAMEETGGELIIEVYRDGDEVKIEVIDTGPGIPAELRERVFEAYFSTKRGGTGLGLPTVRRIVEEHGGRLMMQSEPGKGTQFVICLPIRREV
ncbi:MAG: PAS domain-containing sensor histidine kinase [Planctomycetota bacterium]